MLQFSAVSAPPTRIFAPQGIKIGEVTQTSAIVWTRTTDASREGHSGQVQIEYKATNATGNRESTEWQSTWFADDFTTQFELTELKPGTEYDLKIHYADFDSRSNMTIDTSFRTAPAADDPRDINFVVIGCQQFETRDTPNGQRVYETMLAVKPDFAVHTGDIVYYDKPDPVARDIETARFKWHRMYGQPLLEKFHNRVPTYFQQDDHDVLKNDSWKGQTAGELKFAEGLSIFDEQTPTPATPYRTVRWGRNLQIWLLEGREFRSPNNMADGPEKTILGSEQFLWLARTLKESDATFKVIISPTPIVGPDRDKKNDNHANFGFKHEGDKLRKLLASVPNTFTVCGDRHWQYVSVDPVTGLREYSVGPTTDKHAGGWSQDKFVENMHRFLRVKGGFLSVAVMHEGGEPQLVVRHHAVDGEVVHEDEWTAIIESGEQP